MAAEDETKVPAKKVPARKAAAKKVPAKKVPAKKVPAKAPAPTTPDPNQGSTVTDDQTDDASRNGKAETSPESLAAEIERTRADLSVTLDAIAEKVSPKRAAVRTGKKVTTAVKGSAESVMDGAHAVKDKVTGSGADGPVADTLSAAGPKKDPVIALPPVALAGIAAAVVAFLIIRRRRR